MALVHSSPKIVTDNLILYVDAANTKSYPGTGTVWKDLSGNGNNGTLTNGPTYIVGGGGSFSFDGNNDYVGFPQINFAGTEITAAIWAYGVNNNASSTIYFTNSDGNRELNVHIPWSNDRVYFDKAGGADNNFDRIDKAVTSAEYQGWHHWVFTTNSSTGSMKMYNNGTLFDSSTGNTRPLSNVNGNIRRIARSNSTQRYYGEISNLQIYKKELSASEVTQNFDATKSRFGL